MSLQENQKLLALIQVLPQAAAVFNEDGYIIFRNKPFSARVKKLLNYQPRLHFEAVVHPLIPATLFDSIVDKLRLTGTFVQQLEFFCEEGYERLSVQWLSLAEGKVLALLPGPGNSSSGSAAPVDSTLRGGAATELRENRLSERPLREIAQRLKLLEEDSVIAQAQLKELASIKSLISSIMTKRENGSSKLSTYSAKTLNLSLLLRASTSVANMQQTNKFRFRQTEQQFFMEGDQAALNQAFNQVFEYLNRDLGSQRTLEVTQSLQVVDCAKNPLALKTGEYYCVRISNPGSRFTERELMATEVAAQADQSLSGAIEVFRTHQGACWLQNGRGNHSEIWIYLPTHNEVFVPENNAPGLFTQKDQLPLLAIAVEDTRWLAFLRMHLKNMPLHFVELDKVRCERMVSQNAYRKISLLITDTDLCDRRHDQFVKATNQLVEVLQAERIPIIGWGGADEREGVIGIELKPRWQPMLNAITELFTRDSGSLGENRAISG